jgi:tRNA(Ile)-lysidine synthase
MPRSKKCSVPAATEPGPVSPVEAGRLFSSVEQCRCLLLAVSGGSDSMALMVLADRWARETGWPGRLHVAVVDHGFAWKQRTKQRSLNVRQSGWA